MLDSLEKILLGALANIKGVYLFEEGEAHLIYAGNDANSHALNEERDT